MVFCLAVSRATLCLVPSHSWGEMTRGISRETRHMIEPKEKNRLGCDPIPGRVVLCLAESIPGEAGKEGNLGSANKNVPPPAGT